jgi:ABC-type uncharacterized transport system auxiliary subunit
MRPLILLLAPVLLAACLSKNKPIETRYFDPRLPELSGEAVPAGSPLTVRLGYVTAAPFLRERIVWRLAPNEVGFDDLNYWAAPPDMLAEDALKRYLVPQNGFVRTDSASADTLYVYVAAFEVDRDGKQVVVQLQATLHEPKGTLQRGAFEAKVGADIDDPRAVAQAAGAALADATRRIGEWLNQTLGR